MNKGTLFSSFFIFLFTFSQAQQIQLTPTADQIKLYSPEWKGERFADGRPKVADKLLDRLRNISMEEAWGYLRSKGFQNQYEGDWQILRADSVMVGRVVTAQYMPLRPDMDSLIRKQGRKDGRVGGTNSWPIDMLKDGDIYVADSYGKIADGTLIGDNLGNSIYAHSHKGVIFYGSVRDVEGLEEIKGFNAWMKGSDPSYIQQMMLTGINVPIRIGRASVLPGDVVLAKKTGTIFIPASLVEDLVLNSEFIQLKDEFGHLRLREKKYTPGQIDQQWTDEIKKDFIQWLDSKKNLPMSRQELDEYMKKRTW
jgi:4-hydroxy-4-methyl-2-oxoglutarate aldolase